MKNTTLMKQVKITSGMRRSVNAGGYLAEKLWAMLP